MKCFSVILSMHLIDFSDIILVNFIKDSFIKTKYRVYRTYFYICPVKHLHASSIKSQQKYNPNLFNF